MKTRVTAEKLMTPISAEDKCFLMRYNKRIAVLIFAVLLGLSLAYSFYFTQPNISDIDPSTYIIIPIIMLPVFALFYIKENIKDIDIGKKDILFGLIFFIVSILTTSILRVWLSYLFLTYRIDIIIFPLMILSLISLIFGVKNIKKFIPIILYSILASPLIIIFLINQNAVFTVINTEIVYSVVKIFVGSATYLAPITILANGYRIGIGESCVGLGIIISIIFLLVPVAYFYNGKLKNKILWVISGVVIILILNIFRMTLIALDWIFNGPTGALSIFHEFAGILIFYIAIIITLLISQKFKLGFPEFKKLHKRNKNNFGLAFIGITLACIFSFLYFINYAGYQNIYLSPTLKVNNYNFSYNAFKQEISSINAKGYNEELIPENNTYVIALYNATNGIEKEMPIVFSYSNSSYYYKNVPNLEFNNGGATSRVFYILNNNTAFVVYEKDIFSNINNQSYSSMHIYAVIPAYEAEQVKCSNNLSTYSAVYNFIGFHFYNKTVYDALNNGECFIEKIVIN